MRAFDRIRRTLAQVIAPPRPVRAKVDKPKRPARKAAPGPSLSYRTYAMAKNSRLTSGWGQSTTSEDAELSSSLKLARQRSRELMRDYAYAKRIKTVIVNNVVGTRIGLQAQVMTSRDQLNERINDEIEEVFERHGRGEFYHTGGQMSESEFDRHLVGQVVESGEIFVREHYTSFGGGKIPYALEVIEPERIADELYPEAAMGGSSGVRLGIEMDRFYRPLAYLIRGQHPGDLRVIPGQTDQVERVPADQIIHLRLIDRWPQTRAIPWLHATARALNDMDGLTEAEIIAARGAANTMGIITTPSGEFAGEEIQDNAPPQLTLEPGTVQKLATGEQFQFVSSNRPNTALDPFLRMMLRQAAAGAGPSYESISRDYSQSNYSSSRMGLLDDRDLWRVLQRWFICQFKQRMYRRWMQMAVLSRAITSIAVEQYALSPEKFEAVRFKPRGWSWIDPKSEVEAYIRAIEAGFMTVSEVIALTGGGRDLEDVLNERERELKAIKAKGLVFVTNPDMMKAEVTKANVQKVNEDAAKEDDAKKKTDEEDAERFRQIMAAGVGGANGNGH